MATRLSHLRIGVQRPILQAASRTRPCPPIPFRRPLSHSSSRPLWSSSSRAWALVPLAGGLGLYLIPRETSPLPAVLSSPTLIPCRKRRPVLIESPAEPQRSILSRILSLLNDWFLEPLLITRRFVYLFVVFVPVIATAPMLVLGAPEKRLDGDRWGAVWWYDFLVTQMARAGPTFIKLAQWAGSRTDLFPPLLCEKLGRLHSSGKPHHFKHTKRVIESVFGKDFDEIFEHFDHEPIGVGAIAQVYRATLRKDLLPPSYFDPKRANPKGLSAFAPPALQDPPQVVPTAAVAIKIKHPKVDQMIMRDLAIINFFADALTLLPGMQWLSLPEEVAVFGRIMQEQLNLAREADNLARFERNFSARREPVSFPRALSGWSTHEMLVEEFQHALPLAAFLRNGGGPFDDELAELGLDAFLNMLLLDNFVHSDLHPGNIMVKFVKPSTRLLLRNVLAAAVGRGGTAEPYSSQDSDAIVTKLVALQHDPPAWRAALEEVSAAGYVAEIVLLDAGLVTELDTTNRDNFLELFRAIAEFDGYRAGHLMVERCRTPELALDPETFALKIQHLVLDVKRKTFSLGQIRISDVLTAVLKAVRDHHVKMEGDFVNTVISILLLEGIGRQLDPNLDLFASALPILRQLGRQMSTQDTLSQVQPQDIFSMLKVYVYLEARGLANAAFVNFDDMIRYDRLTPNV